MNWNRVRRKQTEQSWPRFSRFSRKGRGTSVWVSVASVAFWNLSLFLLSLVLFWSRKLSAIIFLVCFDTYRRVMQLDKDEISFCLRWVKFHMRNIRERKWKLIYVYIYIYNLHGLSCQEKVSRFSMLLIPRYGTSLAVSHWKLRMVLMVEYRYSRLDQNKPFYIYIYIYNGFAIGTTEVWLRVP